MGVYTEPSSRAIGRIRRKKVRISVMGLGTVGLALAVHLAHVGYYGIGVPNS